jgi:hypothetical protein
MIRWTLVLAAGVFAWTALSDSDAHAQQAYGRQWGNSTNVEDLNRFYHYPYVYYPQNYYSSDYYQSSNNLYHRYPPEMGIPVYNRQWHNFYPTERPYHSGHHFILDVF